MNEAKKDRPEPIDLRGCIEVSLSLRQAEPIVGFVLPGDQLVTVALSRQLLRDLCELASVMIDEK